MGNFRYGKELLNSFGEVFKKPILLLPFVYLFILNTIFLFIKNNMLSYEQLDPVNMGIIIWILGLGLIQILLMIVFNGMSLASFRMHLNDERITCGNQAFQGCRMYWKLLLLRIYQTMIMTIPLVVLFAIYFGILLFNKQIAIIIGIILLILYIIYLIIMVFFFLFSNVIIAYDGKGAGAALTESHRYFKQNSAHTLFTFLTIVIYMLIFGLIIGLLSLPFTLSAMNSETSTVSIWYDIIVALISIPVMAAMMLYLFKAFNHGGGEEKRQSKALSISDKSEKPKKATVIKTDTKETKEANTKSAIKAVNKKTTKKK